MRVSSPKASSLLRSAVQIVGYETAPVGTRETAALRLATDHDVERVPLPPGERIAYRLGDRRCAGTVDDGTHDPCSAAAAPYCADHTDRWACARCTGRCDLPLPSCRDEHAVYLAGFRPATFKVGVTRDWRVETRLREQGADRGAHLRSVANGRIAREIEADIATAVGDSVRLATKIRGLHEPFDVAAWRTLLGDYAVVTTVSLEYGLDLRDRPVRETLAAGTVRGTKGRLLLLDVGGSTYAVDLRDLVGYEIEPGRTDRDLQASLAAWS